VKARALKTEMLKIRLAPAEIGHLSDAATASHLDLTSWARSILLREADAIMRTKETSTPKSRKAPP
jgi:hypothetical protein